MSKNTGSNSQIWIAVSVYVLVAIVKKRLDLDASLYTLLQIHSVTLMVKLGIPFTHVAPRAGAGLLVAMI